jgi:DNA processing protein
VSEACDACLRRGHLVGHLAPHIAGILDRRRKRPAGLLSLPDEVLVEAVAGNERKAAYAYLESFDPTRARELLEAAGVGSACIHGGAYPDVLSDLTDAPAALFHVGRCELLAGVDTEPAATVVGTRRASPYGLGVAHELGRGLGAAGITVVSGLALGVDAAAHRGALEVGGGTVAVLACGPDVPYPRRHSELHRQIRVEGLVVSEMPPGTPAYRWSFPARNRVMAALGRVTIVVEAGEHSGTLITAEVAQDIGRTVAAVPGRVTSRMAAGGNRLLREGAAVVRDAQDALDELLGVGARAAVEPASASLDPLLDAVEAGLDIDDICAAAVVTAGEARAGLAGLEAKGLVRRHGLAAWERTA